MGRSVGGHGEECRRAWGGVWEGMGRSVGRHGEECGRAWGRVWKGMGRSGRAWGESGRAWGGVGWGVRLDHVIMHIRLGAHMYIGSCDGALMWISCVLATIVSGVRVMARTVPCCEQNCSHCGQRYVGVVKCMWVWSDVCGDRTLH